MAAQAHGLAGHPGLEAMQMPMGMGDHMMHHAEAGRVSYDTNDDMGQQNGGNAGPGASALLGRKHAPDRRPLRFWQPFNDWWRSELERLGRRPTSQEIGEWYGVAADSVWADTKPTLQETRVHAKCLRSLPLVRDYFRNYRAKKKAKGSDGSGLMDGEDGEGDTEDGVDNASGRRGRRGGGRKRSAAAAAAAAAAAEADDDDSAKAAAAMASMAGMGPMEMMQMQQAGMMLSQGFWAGMEGADADEYARAIMMQQHLQAAMLQQQMAAAAVAAQQLTGQQFGVPFPAHDDDDDEEDTDPDGHAAAANAPADAGAEVASGMGSGHAAAAAGGSQSDLAAGPGVMSAQDGSGLQPTAPQMQQQGSQGTDDDMQQYEEDPAASAGHMQSPAGDDGDDSMMGVMHQQQQMQQQQDMPGPSHPHLAQHAPELDSAAVAAAVAAMHHVASVAPAAEHAAQHALGRMGVLDVSDAAMQVADEPNDPQHTAEPGSADAEVPAQPADMQMADLPNGPAAADGGGLQKVDSSGVQVPVPPVLVGLHLGGDVAATSNGMASAVQQHGIMAADGGVAAEQPAMTASQQPEPEEAEAPRAPEADEVVLLREDELLGMNQEGLVAHIKELQEELYGKRELLKRSFDQLRRTQERLGRRERKLGKEQQKCRQYQHALAAWQASLVPGMADPAAQELYTAQMQVAMAAQAAAAAQHNSMVQQQQ